MAAKLNLRKGTSFTNPSISEPFFNTDSNTLEVGYGTTTGEHVTLTKLGINTGSISFTGDVTASNMLLTGDLTVRDITLSGNIYVGDEVTDTITVTGQFDSNLLPSASNQFDLGSDTKIWKTVHALTGSFGNGIISGSSQLTDDLDLRYLEIGGDNVFSSSIQVDLTQTTNYSSGIKTRLDVETVISGSSQVNVNDTQNFSTFSSSVDSRFDYLEGDFSTSVDDRLDQLEIYTGSVDSLYEEIASATHTLVSGSSQIDVNDTQNFTTFSSSVDSRLDTIEGPLSTSLDSRLDSLESFSSSLDDTFVTTTELNTATSSLSASLTITDVDFESRINTLETTFSSSVDSRLDTIEGPFSQSVDSRLDVIEGSFSQSVDLRLDELESTGSEHESRLDNIELYTASLDNTYEEKASSTHTLFSGSSQVNADTITNFDSNVKTKLDLDNIVSSSVQVTISDTTGYTTFSSSIATTDEGQNDRLDSIEAYTASVDSLYEEISSGTHTLVSGSSQIQIDSVSGFTAHSSSVDSRLDSLEGDSHTHSNKVQLDTINQNLSKTSNVTFNDITASGNVIVSGDLTVLGTATEIQTSELVIKDKLITIASGSTNSAEADGSGIEIDGAGKSIIWDDATQSFILNAKVSSSVGFKGDGSELDNVTASDVEYDNVLNKPTLVSGSSQISFDGITDKPTLVSGSSQIDHDLTTNFVGNEHIDHSTVSISAGDGISGGGDITITRTLTLDTGSVHFKGGVKEKLNEESVVSGSSQILGGTGILSSSNENFTQFSSSIDSRVDTLEGTFSQSVDSRLDYIEGSFSQSVDSRLDLQEAFSESLDNEFLNTNGDNVVSGSTGEQLTASLDLRYEDIASGTNTLVSGSSQIDVTQTTKIETLATTGSNLFLGNQTITGSLESSGSVSFQGIPWPSIGSESHILKTQPYTLNLASGDRTYDYAGIALEHFEDAPSYYHNSIAIYSFDNHDTPSFGTEFNVGPLRNHMRVYPSSSSEVLDTTHLGNISVEDLQDGNSRIKIYADDLQIGVFNSEGITIGNPASHIYFNANEIVSDSPISSSNHISASFFIGDGSQLENIIASEITYEDITNLPSGLVSGSSQIDVTQTTNYSSIRQYDDTDNTTHLNSLSVVSGSTYSSPSQGTLRATINGANSDVDLGLQSTDTPTFNSLTASNLPEHSTDIYDAVFKGTSGEFGYRTLRTAAFHHVSNSIDDGTPNAIGTAGAVKTYVDAKIIAASAGDITEVNAGDGLSGGSTIGAATLTLDTGSQHFIDGVTSIAPTLPTGLVSSSDQVTQSLDTRYVTQNGDNVISGSLFVEDIDDAQERVIFEVNNREATIFQVNNDIYSTNHGAEIIMNLANGHGLFDGDIIISGDLTVNGTTTTINTTNLNVEDNIIELNYGGSATNGGILVKDVTGGSTTSGSLLWDGTTDSWIAGTLGSENRILTTADNVITDGNIDDKIKLKLDTDNVHSGSYLGTATTSQLDEGTRLYYTDVRVKTKLNVEGVISGSSQVLGTTGILSSSNENFTDFSSSVDSRFGALSTDYNDLQNVPSGIVSSSEQVSNYNTFLEINGDGVISGSSQVQINSVTGFTSFSSSVDGRIDLLESFSSSLDAGFVTEAELNTATQSLQDSIDLKLDISTYTPFSTSVDNRIDLLESFSSSLDAEFVTEAELNTATQSLQDSIDLKLDISTYTPFSTSVDSRLDGLEGVTSENPLTFTDTSTIDFTRVGDIITADVIGGVVSGSSQVIGILDSLNTYTSSNDTNQTTQNGRLTALEVETGSISTEQSIQDGRLTNLESYTASVDNLYEEKASATHTLLSGSSQVQVDSVTGFTPFSSSVDSRIGSLEGDIHTHSNKTNLDTINQDLSTTSNVQFNNIEIDGTGSFGSDVTIYGNLNVFGTESIINSENLAIADNMIYLNSGSTVTNPDLGWAGNYNDGTYAHAGFFRDASDGGTFKIYEGYTPEPEGSIDTAHASFALADFQAGGIEGTSITTDSLIITSGGLERGSIYGDTDGVYLTAPAGKGIGILTDGATDGMLIQADGSTTIYGSLSLENIPLNGSSDFVVVVGAGNTMNYRQLGSNAFNSTSYLTSESDTLATVTGRGASTATAISITNTTASTTKTTGALVVAGGIGTSGDVFAGGDVVAYASSDRRLKDNILPIENPLQKINSIGGYSFEWNVEKQHIYKGKDYGVIAQEIEEILPELVDTRENGYKAVKYDKLVSLLIESIKELSTEVEQLKQQINK